jgi:phage terminase, small subunit, putative, P27 family
MQGRKPIPSHLKLILGNPGKRPVPSPESLPEATAPGCPGHLGAHAQAEWKRIVPELMTLGLLQRMDMAQLAAYCTAYGRWVEVELEILKLQQGGAVSGLLVKTPNGYPQISPLLAISNKCLEQIHTFASEFGLSPVMRSRVEALSMQRPLFPDDPMESALRAASPGNKATA